MSARLYEESSARGYLATGSRGRRARLRLVLGGSFSFRSPVGVSASLRFQTSRPDERRRPDRALPVAGPDGGQRFLDVQPRLVVTLGYRFGRIRLVEGRKAELAYVGLVSAVESGDRYADESDPLGQV